MNDYIKLKRKVMARIYFEYTKNTFLAYPDYFMFALFVATSFVLVSFHDVLNNIPKDSFPHAFNFFVLAVERTSWVLQVLIVGFIIRVVVGSSMFAYKNFNTKWSISRILKLNRARY